MPASRGTRQSRQRTHHFAQAMGVLGKTDAIDARILVDFAQKAEVRLAIESSETSMRKLRSPSLLRRQLVESAPQRRTPGVPHHSPAARPCSSCMKTPLS